MASLKIFKSVAKFVSTTESPVRAFNESDFDIWAESVVNIVDLYYTLFVVLFGVIGNMLSLYVFYATKLRLQSTSQYLSALAVSDTVFLLQLIPPWLSTAQITSIFHKTIYCKIFEFLYYVTCCLSGWLELSFTLERFVAVIYPLRRNAVCTVARARAIIAGLVVTSLVLNIPVLKLAAASDQECNIDREYLEYAARFNMVDTMVSFTIPLGGIVFLNTWIAYGVWKLESARRRLMKTERVRGPLRSRCSRLLGCQRAQQRVTKMLLIVSSVFVLFNLPAYTLRILAYASSWNKQEMGGRWTALQQLAQMSFNTNFSINFILYCVAGQNFRHALVQAIPWLRRRRFFAAQEDTATQPRTGSLSISYASHTGGTYGAATATDNARSQRPDQFHRSWPFVTNRHRCQADDYPRQDEGLEMSTFRNT